MVETGKSLEKETLDYSDNYKGQQLERVFDIRATKLGDGFAAAWRDVSEHKYAEDLLRESEEKYRTLFDNAGDMIGIQDMKGHFLEVNKITCERMGYSREEFLQKTIMDIGSPKYGTLILERIKQLKESDRILFESESFKKDGSTIPVEVTAVVFKYKGKPAILSVARDVTERKQLESQLQQSQKMEAIGRLAGGVAHDFNNLLTAIIGYSEMLKMDKLLNRGSMLYVEEIIKSADRAANLTQQLLAFSRKQVLQPKIIDLNKLLTEIDKMLHRLIGEDIELKTELVCGLGQMKADPGQIEQVTMNLAVNARDAMPRGGKLTIETQNVYLDKNYCKEHGVA